MGNDVDKMIKSLSQEPMNIYFSCSITGGRKDQHIYEKIVKFLLDEGHQVPTAHLASKNLMGNETLIDAVDVYRRDLGWVSECDVLVAEVSTPSHGVGYEIAAAVFQGKGVICCHEMDVKISKIISGNTNKNLHVFAYRDEEQLIKELKKYLKMYAVSE